MSDPMHSSMHELAEAWRCGVENGFRPQDRAAIQQALNASGITEDELAAQFSLSTDSLLWIRTMGIRFAGSQSADSVAAMVDACGVDLLEPVGATCVRVHLTTQCNLRCVYCAVSSPDWKSEDLGSRAMAQVTEQLPGVADKSAIVLVNGAGETTFLDGWEAVCESMLGNGLLLGMTTNLAKQYSAQEIDVLSRFSLLMVSIDSFDDAILRPIRRKVSAQRIVDNICAIRAAAYPRAGPRIRLSCGLYDRNVPGLKAFALQAIELRVEGVTFWNLDKHEALPGMKNISPLYELPVPELAVHLRTIDEAIAAMTHAGLQVEVTGDFVNALHKACNQEEICT